jgi:CspA family cold shock protein
MQLGKVKWFNNAKGYGFIVDEADESTDLFVHYSAIQGDGYKSLKAGDQVSFELADTPKGPQARNITALAKPEVTPDSNPD